MTIGDVLVWPSEYKLNISAVMLVFGEFVSYETRANVFKKINKDRSLIGLNDLA